MKVRKFIFKFIDHSSRQIMVFMISIHSDDKHEWTEREGDVESFVQWKAKCARWYYELKQQVKAIVKEAYFGNTQGFADYRLACVKEFKESKKVNLSNAPGPVHQMRLVKMMKKHTSKYERGNKPSDWKQVLDYSKKVEHQHFKLSGDVASGSVNIQPIDKRIVIHQGSTQAGVQRQQQNLSGNVPMGMPGTTGFSQGAPYGQQNALPGNTGTPIAGQGNVVLQPIASGQRGGYGDDSNGHMAHDRTSAYRNSRDDSGDGIDYQQKYDKYKRKYMELKKNQGQM